MKRIEERFGEMVEELPLEVQHEVEDVVRFLYSRNCLADWLEANLHEYFRRVIIKFFKSL